MTAITEIPQSAIENKEQHHYSPEEYFELETSAEYRSEYCDGEIITMTGGTPNHNQIAGNFYAALNFALKGQPYRVYITDMRLGIPQNRLYTYPDVMVVSGQLEFAEGRKDTITNPVMIAEVLSDSTEDYDRGKKFKLYRSIPSFREYLLISQSERYVEQFSKTADNKWLLSEWAGEDAVLALSSVLFQISLADLYDKVEFESGGEEGAGGKQLG
jgi:Uma2 family endonuclease